RLQAIFNGTPYTGPGGSFTPAGRHAAFATNVGTLVEPLTVADARAFLNRWPKNVGSHNDQIMQWQTCFPQGSSGTGWVGRLADQLYSSGNKAEHLFNMISLDGVSPALTGSRYQHHTDGSSSGFVNAMSAPVGPSADRYVKGREALQAILQGQLDGSAQTNILTRAYARSVLEGLQANEEYQDKLNAVAVPSPILSVSNTHNMVGKMRRVAHIIKAFRTAATNGGASYTGPRRQVFFLTLGGWDHHNGTGSTHFDFMNLLDGALAEFYAQMEAQGALNDVTAFTASDFGRALVPNGDGTDHAWGGNQIVMGGAVNGGDIYGQYPAMLRKADNETLSADLYGNGVFVPTLAVDQYMQRLGKWLLVGTGGSGWSDSQDTSPWRQVLPNWGGFATLPIGQQYANNLML
ncbi:MAG: DUF1501 domain-containing protein, partial [Verrucomicrobia bacterium]|nr:DUF1501 domain-containing protein [Verrucomicrobiota bacterium]